MKTLMDEYNVQCATKVKSYEDDPVGGYRKVYTDGVLFEAAWEFQSAPEITVAEQQGTKRTYRIYVHPTLDLDYHDVIERKDNGQIYRVTTPGTDRKTPGFSAIGKRLIEVEQWELPTDAEETNNVQSSGSA